MDQSPSVASRRRLLFLAYAIQLVRGSFQRQCSALPRTVYIHRYFQFDPSCFHFCIIYSCLGAVLQSPTEEVARSCASCSNQAISPSLHQAQLHIVRRGDQHQPPLVPFLTIGLLNTFATTAARLTRYYSAGNCLRLLSVYRSNLQPWTAHRSIMPRARTGLTL